MNYHTQLKSYNLLLKKKKIESYKPSHKKNKNKNKNPYKTLYSIYFRNIKKKRNKTKD